MDRGADVARQLVDAFSDALEHGDADALEYAADQLDDFIDETDDDTADEVLVALLDLPRDPSALPLLDQVSRKLTRRGPGAVEALLGAVLGDAPPELRLSDIISVAGAVGALLEAATRSPNVPPRAGNALATLDAMALGDLILGLIEVLEGRADERLKQAASEMLVDIGEPAVERLKTSLRDRDAAPWVVDTLVDIRDGRDAARDAPDDPRDAAADDDGAEPGASPAVGAAVDAPPGPLADGAAPSPPAGPPAPPAGLPAGDDIDREFAAFLEKFKRETGQQ